MKQTRIKICGMTCVSDAAFAAKAGADAIGLVFLPGSPRAVEAGLASTIANAMPPFVSVVGLFVDAEPAFVRMVTSQVRLDLLQFHGSEPAEFCRRFGVPYIKAIRMQAGIDLAGTASAFADAAALLLDAHVPDKPGGSGRTFDWKLGARPLARPVIVAGGLSPANVGEAIRTLAPFAVDVSSGVESAPGIKDREKMTAFVAAVRKADSGEAGSA